MPGWVKSPFSLIFKTKTPFKAFIRRSYHNSYYAEDYNCIQPAACKDQ
jgi:hypothetical protein